MGKLTGTTHGDSATLLFSFYQDSAEELEKTGQYFMAAVALALAVEAALLAYLLVEFGEESGGELHIPDSVAFGDLIEAANQIAVLQAPIDTPSHIRSDGALPAHVAKDVIEKIRRFRNLVHPARALKESFNPAAFTPEHLQEYKAMYESIMHSLTYHL